MDAPSQPVATPTVAQIMTRNVVTIGMDDSLRAVRSLFNTHKFHHLVVIDRGRAVGMISDRDLLKHLSPFLDKGSERPQDTASLNLRAHQIMTRQLVACVEATSIHEAGQLMLGRGVSCLPVLDAEGRCKGIVTLHDLLRWSVEELAGTARRAA